MSGKEKGKKMTVYSTKDVARLLNVPIHTISQLVWKEKISPLPTKGPGGAYMWGQSDIERVSWVLRRKSADDIFREMAV